MSDVDAKEPARERNLLLWWAAAAVFGLDNDFRLMGFALEP